MRAVAAIGVLLWHASIFLGPYGEGIGAVLFQAPSIMGVDLFFLICGFVIFLSSTKTAGGITTAISPAVFLIKRLARICPLYLACTLAVFFIERNSERQTWELLFRSLLFLPVNNTDYPNIFSPTMTVGWSINYEVYFYLLFSAALLSGGKFWKPLAIWAAIIILAPTMFALGPAFLAIMTGPLNLLFLTGILTGALYRANVRFPNRTAAIIAVVIAPLPAGLQYVAHIGIAHGLSGVGASLAFMLAVIVIADKTLHMRCNRLLTYLGDTSYSIYLTHPIVMWAVAWANERYAWGNPLQGWFCVGVTLLATIAVSALSYRYIEVGLSVRVREWALTKLAVRNRAADLRLRRETTQSR